MSLTFSKLLTGILIILALGLPVAFWLAQPQAESGTNRVPVERSTVSHFPPSTWKFQQLAMGGEPGFRPRITNVRIVDLDQDGLPDILACDAQKQRVFWYRQLPDRQWEEVPVGPELNSPAGAIAVDLDGDGDLDVVVAVLGNVIPSNERIGQVVWLENLGKGRFESRVILDHVRRVSDVQAADLTGDGKPDLAVAVFGYHHGEILWLENHGNGAFEDHHLMTTQGPSHVPIADFTGDGKPDIAALVSQDYEEVWLFENQGTKSFTPRRVFASSNFDLGGAGLITTDLDQDGLPDLLLVAGDNLEVNHHFPQPWHGCIWLRNTGQGAFTPRRIGHVGGVYGVAAADVTGNGHMDVVLSCMFNDWRDEGAASLVLLENDGSMNFTPSTIATKPIYLATVAAGDINQDGRADIVAGSMFLRELFTDRSGRITLWLSHKE